MILHNLTLTGKGHAFLILHPEELELNNELLDKLIPTSESEFIKISTGDWLYYKAEESDDEDDLSAWNMPGIKMVVSDEITYEKAKQVADKFVTDLKNSSKLHIELVVIDQERLSRL